MFCPALLTHDSLEQVIYDGMGYVADRNRIVGGMLVSKRGYALDDRIVGADVFAAAGISTHFFQNTKSNFMLVRKRMTALLCVRKESSGVVDDVTECRKFDDVWQER